MTKNTPYDIPIDGLICFMLGLITVILVVKPLADIGFNEWWWGFFIVCNLAYVIYGIKTGQVKGDPANGLMIAMGPITFYSWTYLGAWRKYRRKR